MNKAQAMVNKSVVIGLTYYNHDGSLFEQEQMHGKITSVESDCVKVLLEGHHKGETVSLPRHLRAFLKAKSGVYTMRSTGEEVVDPDYTTSWEIRRPPPEKA